MSGSALVLNDIDHGIRQERGRTLPEDRFPGNGCRVEYDIALMVLYLCVEARLQVGTLVCDTGIGTAKLQRGNTLRESAEGQRSDHVGKNTIAGLIVIRERGDAEGFRVVISQFGSDLRDAFNRDHVDGADDGLPDGGGISVIAHIPVADFCPVIVIKIPVAVCGRQRFSACVDRRTERCQDLEGGSRLPGRVTGPVQGKGGLLAASAADKRFDVTRGLIHDDQGSLRLGRNGHTLTQHGIPFTHRGIPEMLRS